MKKGKKLLSLLLAMVMVLSLFTLPVQAAATKKVTNQTKSVVMVVKQQSTIKPPVKMTYRSSNPKVVAVNSKGVMVAKTKGSAIVTGSYKSVKWTYRIKVEAPRLNASSLRLNPRASAQLKVTGTTRNVSWSSSAPRIATVTAKINGVRYSCKVTVSVPKTNYVWICSTGKKYHKYSTCSNMNRPYKVTISKAKSLGYDACKKCYR